jgi:hypothetical protein
MPPADCEHLSVKKVPIASAEDIGLAGDRSQHNGIVFWIVRHEARWRGGNRHALGSTQDTTDESTDALFIQPVE